jgi:hypothetical protein
MKVYKIKFFRDSELSVFDRKKVITQVRKEDSRSQKRRRKKEPLV